MESKNMQYNGISWIIKEENFLNFYKLTAYIIPYKFTHRYKVYIWLNWEHCSCSFCILEVTDLKTIHSQIEDYVKNNYANIFTLPRFVKILKELELPYTTTFSFVNMATLNVNVREDNIAELIKKYQDLLNNEWKMLIPFKRIQKYTKQNGLENTKSQ